MRRKHLDGLVQALETIDHDPAQIFLRLDERTIGNQHFADFRSQRLGLGSALESDPAKPMTISLERLVEGDALFDHCIELFFGAVAPAALRDISKARIIL